MIHPHLIPKAGLSPTGSQGGVQFLLNHLQCQKAHYSKDSSAHSWAVWIVRHLPSSDDVGPACPHTQPTPQQESHLPLHDSSPEFPGALFTEYCKLGGVNHVNLLSHSSGDWKSKIKVLARLGPSEGCGGGSAPWLSLSFRWLAGDRWHSSAWGYLLSSSLVFHLCACLSSKVLFL